MTVLSEGGLQFLDGAAGFDADGEIGPSVLDDFVEAGCGKNDLGAGGRVTPGKLGATAARNYGKARVIGETKSGSKLLFVSGFEDKARLNAANGVSRSGRAHGIGSAVERA